MEQSQAPQTEVIENSPELDPVELPKKGCCKRLRKSKDPMPNVKAKELRDLLCQHFKAPGAASEIRQFDKRTLAYIKLNLDEIEKKKAQKAQQPAKKKQKKEPSTLEETTKCMNSTATCLGALSACLAATAATTTAVTALV
jgi:hypothetical protein